MNNMAHFREIAQGLRRLRQSSPRTNEGLDAWYAECDRFTETFRSRFPGVALPAQVRHFLNDADIRIKDAEYRNTQDETLSEIIAELERGVIPASSGLDITVRPQWLVAIVGALTLVIYWFYR